MVGTRCRTSASSTFVRSRTSASTAGSSPRFSNCANPVPRMRRIAGISPSTVRPKVSLISSPRLRRRCAACASSAASTAASSASTRPLTRIASRCGPDGADGCRAPESTRMVSPREEEESMSLPAYALAIGATAPRLLLCTVMVSRPVPLSTVLVSW